MAEDKFVHSVSGQEMQEDDINKIATAAAGVDDYVLAELFKLPAFNSSGVAKGVIPFGTDTKNSDWSSIANAIVQPAAGQGGVFVFPFRAVIGSTTAATSAPSGSHANPNLDSVRDIRSKIYCPQNVSGLGFPIVTLAANSSGNPRWDLIYATFARDQASANVTRFVKPPSPSTASAAPASLSLYTIQGVTVSVVAGTAAASPVFPSLPSDSGSNYYIPLAYVRVPNGFSGASTVLRTDIHDAAPMLGPYNGARVQPASSMSKVGGAVVSTAAQQSWGSSGTRPSAVLPAGIIGKLERYILLDFLSASSANWSHASGGIVDDTVDWSWRFFKTTATALGGAGTLFSTENPPPATVHCVPTDAAISAASVQLGSSHATNGVGQMGYYDPTVLTALNAASSVHLTVNSSGQLIVTVTGSPLAKIFVWLEASGSHALR